MNEDIQQSILNSDVIYALTRNLPNPELISDETLNDSDKTLTVDADEIWEIVSIRIELTTTSAINNRQLVIVFRDVSDDIIFSVFAGTEQAPSLLYKYHYGQGLPHATTLIKNEILTPLPSRFYLPAGYNIRIYDVNNIDPAADDMIIQMMVNRYDVP